MKKYIDIMAKQLVYDSIDFVNWYKLHKLSYVEKTFENLYNRGNWYYEFGDSIYKVSDTFSDVIEVLIDLKFLIQCKKTRVDNMYNLKYTYNDNEIKNFNLITGGSFEYPTQIFREELYDCLYDILYIKLNKKIKDIL